MDAGLPEDLEWLNDQELLRSMQRGDQGALREFFERFRPLLMTEASRLGVQPALRGELVDQCLDDAALSLIQGSTPLRRSLASYLVVALRHDALNAWRGERRQLAKNVRALHDALGAGAFTAGCSEEMIRASAGPGAEKPIMHPVLERLASALDETLDDEERQILMWIGHDVPQPVIAEWLETTFGALRARVLRIRLRLKDAAIRYAEHLNGEESRSLLLFFRKTARWHSQGQRGPQEWSTTERARRKRKRRPSDHGGSG